jgi:hypothetical protein
MKKVSVQIEMTDAEAKLLQKHIYATNAGEEANEPDVTMKWGEWVKVRGLLYRLLERVPGALRA